MIAPPKFGEFHRFQWKRIAFVSCFPLMQKKFPYGS